MIYFISIAYREILFYLGQDGILFYLGHDGSLDFWVLVLFGFSSVSRSFSVRPNLGRVGFSCGNREKPGEIICLNTK